MISLISDGETCDIFGQLLYIDQRVHSSQGSHMIQMRMYASRKGDPR